MADGGRDRDLEVLDQLGRGQAKGGQPPGHGSLGFRVKAHGVALGNGGDDLLGGRKIDPEGHDLDDAETAEQGAEEAGTGNFLARDETDFLLGDGQGTDDGVQIGNVVAHDEVGTRGLKPGIPVKTDPVKQLHEQAGYKKEKGIGQGLGALNDKWGLSPLLI